MRITLGRQDMRDSAEAQRHCCLLTNGLGGYSSVSAAFSVTRGDQGILVSASVAPTQREVLVHRLWERLELRGEEGFLSTQDRFRENEVEDRSTQAMEEEDGYRHLTTFTWDGEPRWLYEWKGVTVTRTLSLAYGENHAALCYEIENHADVSVTLRVEPGFLLVPKGTSRREPIPHSWDGQVLTMEGRRVWVKTDGALREREALWEKLYYREDAPDGRTEWGMDLRCMEAAVTAEPGERRTMWMTFGDRLCGSTGLEVRANAEKRRRELEYTNPYRDPIARELCRAADAFITKRDSTGGKTIVAGYPFFGDWGRDTMIAFRGCVLESGDFDTAKSILRTFLAYEKDGLVPNLFPEGGEAPRYNTVDAALLLIDCVWRYYQMTGDEELLREAYPVMERIISGYMRGTHHGIRMEEDGLIAAGEGLDQVTWMDVCVEGILPTPRHGKPVEVNAYWYSALRIMEELSKWIQENDAKNDSAKGNRTERRGRSGEDRTRNEPDKSAGGERPAMEQTMTSEDYASLAERAGTSFLRQFWMEEKGYLKDVISGTNADEQLRCNQIWAVTMPFSMLSPQQARRVTETVYRELYTPCGLRTLSPRDPQFHPTYGGPQLDRDLAYHQGTVWVYPLGAFYRAWLKVHDGSEEAVCFVKQRLMALEPMLREGCIGQLPEIYDGLYPGTSRGCFAQAWSVGEILTVYRELEQGDVSRA